MTSGQDLFQICAGSNGMLWGLAMRDRALYPLGDQFKSRSLVALSNNGDRLETDFPS